MTQSLARVQPVTEPLYLSTADLVKRFNVSRTWLWRQDLKPPIKTRIGGKLFWHSVLFEDWMANQGDPEAQQRAIENYLSGLPSNQPRRAGRSPKKSGSHQRPATKNSHLNYANGTNKHSHPHSLRSQGGIKNH